MVPGAVLTDPLFVDEDGVDGIPGSGDDDLGLRPGSPCIDAGDSAAVPPEATTDLALNPRFVDDPATEDSGAGSPAYLDMGAFELVLPAPVSITVGEVTLPLGEAAFPSSAACLDPEGCGAEILYLGGPPLFPFRSVTDAFSPEHILDVVAVDLDDADVFRLDFPTPIENQPGPDLYLAQARFVADLAFGDPEGINDFDVRLSASTWRTVVASRFRRDEVVPAATIWYGDPEIKSDAYRLWFAFVDLDELGVLPGETARVEVVAVASLNETGPRTLLARGEAFPELRSRPHRGRAGLRAHALLRRLCAIPRSGAAGPCAVETEGGGGSRDREVVLVADVRDADDEDAHAPASAVHDSWRDVDDRAAPHRVLDAVEDDASLAVKDVIELGGALVVVRRRAVDVDGVGPRGDVPVLLADEAVAPAAGAALAGRSVFVAHEGREGRRRHGRLQGWCPYCLAATMSSAGWLHPCEPLVR
jgi:hypothetical protein